MRTLALLVLALAASAHVSAQPVLVKDIRTAAEPGSALTSLLFDAAVLGSHLYFAAADGFFGRELWRSDGTAAGTALVADVCSGRCESTPGNFTAAAGVLFFLAGDESLGRELWRSDGTAAGTFPLVDLAPGPVDGDYLFLARLGTRLIFATRGDSSVTLWASDGTAAGTASYADVPGGASLTERPAAAGGFLVFSHFQEDEGIELWRTDGTAAGTGPLPVIRPGPASGVHEFFPRAALGRLFFRADDGVTGWELWTTDGTPAGTARLADLAPGTDGSFPADFTVRDRDVVFIAQTPATGRELWRSDGTAAGTRLIADLVPGPASSGAAILASARGRLLFAANDGSHGLEPWVIDASGAVVPLGDLHPGAAGSITLLPTGGAAGGLLYFAADDGSSGAELWRSDGTPAGTRRAADLTPGPGSSGLGTLHGLGNRVLFGFTRGQSRAERLGASAGSPASTGVVTEIYRGYTASDPRQLTALGARLVFAANDGTHGLEPWSSNGLRAGTRLVGDLGAGALEFGGPDELTVLGDQVLLFTNDFSGKGSTLWSTRGVPGDLRRLRGGQRLLHSMGVVDGAALFFGSEYHDGAFWLVLWRSDGTAQGTRRVATVARAENPSDIGADFFAVAAADGARLYFTPHYALDFIDRESGLWVSDGTAAGTVQAVRDPCGGCTFLHLLRVAGDRLFYLTQTDIDRPLRFALWTSDLTPAGTRPLLEGVQYDGPILSIRRLVTVGGRAFLAVHDGDHGEELWTSDGTLEGTRLVADLRPGPDSSAPDWLTPLGDRLYFAADDGIHGRELWVSDGTAEGTRMVRDIRPGPRASQPQALRTVDGVLAFAADDGVRGLEPWRSDGTPGGTARMADVLLGPFSSSPRDFVAAGSWLFFNAGRPATGYELFRLPRAALTGGPP